jgi:protoporphyrinogen oxidase
MRRDVEGLIIGGGPSGLSVAYALQGNTLVLEKESRVGGLCRSITHQGGVFDIGGHSFHTPHPEVYELVQELLDGKLFLQERDARVFSHGTLIPYPFQKFFDRIPDPDVVRECEEGLRKARTNGAEPEDFQEYIVQKFGAGIAEHFMLPYNRKLWARDIRKISCEWTAERVAGPKGQEERFLNTGEQRKPLQAGTEVGYPPQGGYEEVYDRLAERVPAVETGTAVAHIDPVARIARTADGREYGWRFLVSTMPLPLLLRIVEGVPEELKQEADRLDYMSLRVELLLTRRPLDTPIQRIYVADPDIPPHKIAMNHNSSDFLRAKPHHAIMAEVSISPEKPVDAAAIAPATIDFLCQVGVLSSPDDIMWTGHVDVTHAYPVYTHERPGIMQSLKDWLAPYDIYTVGRFGEWEYINSDKCVAKGLALGRELRSSYRASAARKA